jgi:hypothetical protein
MRYMPAVMELVFVSHIMLYKALIPVHCTVKLDLVRQHCLLSLVALEQMTLGFYVRHSS